MSKRILLGFMSVALIVALWALPATSAVVGISDLQGNHEIWVEPCTQFDATLYLELTSSEINLLADNGIVGYTVDILWDPLVSLVSYTKGGSYTFVDVNDANTGSTPVLNPEWVGSELELNGYNFGADIGITHDLETFVLHCLGPGDTWLTPEGHFGASGNFGLSDVTNYLGSITTVQYQGLQIHQTPIPSTLIIFGSGLVGLIGVRRKMKK